MFHLQDNPHKRNFAFVLVLPIANFTSEYLHVIYVGLQLTVIELSSYYHSVGEIIDSSYTGTSLHP